MTNQTYLQKIISKLKAKVNQYSYNHLVATGNFDADQVYWAMKEYGYGFDEYVRVSFFKRLFSRKAF